MSSARKQFRCLLISPGDVQDERDALSEVFTNWNAHIGRALGASVELIRWETHATPAAGERPQEVLNKQIVDEADLGIALFWSRLGTPTGEFRSRSVEEITRLCVAKKRLMVYFKTAPIPQAAANEEFQRLMALKEELKSTALFETFDSVSSLREKVYLHLATVATDLLRSETSEVVDTLAQKAPRLVNLVDPFVYPLRRSVYDGLRKFLGQVIIDLRVDMEMIAQLHKLREDSEFLFGPEVVTYIREWIKHAAGMKVAREIIDHPAPATTEYQGWLQVHHEGSQYFANQFEQLIEMFRPYLTIPLE